MNIIVNLILVFKILGNFCNLIIYLLNMLLNVFASKQCGNAQKLHKSFEYHILTMSCTNEARCSICITWEQWLGAPHCSLITQSSSLFHSRQLPCSNFRMFRHPFHGTYRNNPLGKQLPFLISANKTVCMHNLQAGR